MSQGRFVQGVLGVSFCFQRSMGFPAQEMKFDLQGEAPRGLGKGTTGKKRSLSTQNEWHIHKQKEKAWRPSGDTKKGWCSGSRCTEKKPKTNKQKEVFSDSDWGEDTKIAQDKIFWSQCIKSRHGPEQQKHP
jgi:hypothetical protein